jgi:aspartyl protease family protein
MEPAANPFGKLFLGLSWVFLLGGLTLYFNEHLKDEANPNRNPESFLTADYAEVRLARNQQHHFVATGRINGQEVTFLVDTGATQVALNPALAARLNLPKGREGFANTANGVTPTFDTRIDRLDLGAITLTAVPASITLGMQNDEVLLGMSALRHLDLQMQDGLLTLRQKRNSTSN